MAAYRGDGPWNVSRVLSTAQPCRVHGVVRGHTTTETALWPFSVATNPPGSMTRSLVAIVLVLSVAAASGLLPASMIGPADGTAGQHDPTFDLQQGPAFDLQFVDPDDGEPDPLVPGDETIVGLEVTNVGDEPATDVTLRLSAEESPIYFGTATDPRPTHGVFLGDLAPEETRTVTLRVGVLASATEGQYPITAAVEHGSGDAATTAGPVPVGFPVAAPQTFDIDDVDSTLRVGESGVVNGTIENTGNRTVSNLVVVFAPGASPVATADETAPGVGPTAPGESLAPGESHSLVPRETEYAVGELRAGEDEEFRFRVDVSNWTEPGPRQVTFLARYDVGPDSEADEPPSETVVGRAAVDVAPAADEFRLEPVRTQVEAGEEDILTVRITNERDRPLTDVAATMTPQEPFSSADATAFVPQLEPGESALVRFDLEADSDAVTGTDSVVLSFTYTDAETDELVASDPYFVPVQVVGPEDGDLSTTPVIVVVLIVILLALGWLWVRGP